MTTLPCAIVGFNESREVAREYSVGTGDECVTLRPLPNTHKRWLKLQLPNNQVLDIEVSEQVATTVLKAWQTHVEFTTPRVGDIVVPQLCAWQAWALSGWPQAFRVGEVTKGQVHDKGTEKHYYFTHVTNITNNPPPSLEPINVDAIGIPSYEAWTRRGYTGLPVAGLVVVSGPKYVMLRGIEEAWDPSEIYTIDHT